ncbi:MAG: YgdI/YgdR family lipoprotein [Gammaproteobacteria bacterium]|nr:YgdI/YgdR family lipoprotein [Gammaproteobacteria bacterium]QOJ33360.1 MAG: YgdI/YgdR family lipoprotein [Gammaproteobacteria bacterium]
MRGLLIVVAVALATACASSEYIISTNDGTMITTHGKPKLDEKTGMYSYEDAEGRKATITKDNVKQIMER